MKKLIVIAFSLIILSMLSCQRAPVPGFGIPFKRVSSNEQAFYNAVLFGNVEEIEPYLQTGHDPDFMNSGNAIPWIDTNPLWRVCSRYEKAELFIRYGADVKKRPYIWGVSSRTPIISNKYPNMELLENIRTRYEDDVYILVKLFLEAGADPNLKGCDGLAPFSFNKDEAYRKYFKKNGYLPIKAPIKYSAFDLVDLLLEHGAILDESCLEAAREATKLIGNDDMENHIQAVWEKQQNFRDIN